MPSDKNSRFATLDVERTNRLKTNRLKKSLERYSISRGRIYSGPENMSYLGRDIYIDSSGRNVNCAVSWKQTLVSGKQSTNYDTVAAMPDSVFHNVKEIR